MKRASIPHPAPRTAPRPALCTLARALVRAGKLSERRAHALQAAARDECFAEVFIAQGCGTPLWLAQFISTTFGYPLIDPAALARTALPREADALAARHRGLALPLSLHARRLTLAMADPTDAAMLEALRTDTGLSLDPVVAPLDALRAFQAENRSRACSAPRV